MLTIAPFPGASTNPYLDLFYDALVPYGAERSEGFLLSPRWYLKNRHIVDVIHFHWPEWLWSGGYERGERGLLKLALLLRAARWEGIKLLWTVHNLDPHEGGDWKDIWGQHLLAKHCDMIVTHSEVVARKARERLRPRGQVVVMPHGSYEGHFPDSRPRADILASLGIPDEGRPILGCVGRLRDYKGLDLACEALARLGDDVRLIIAGVPHDGFDMAPLEMYAARLPQLVLIPRELDDQEFSDLLSIMDVVLLPYRQITGSGALLAAWTRGCGVIASDLDYFRELVPEKSNAGELFCSGSADALADAIRSYLTVPADLRHRAARAMAAEFSWERCVETVGATLQSWSQNSN